MEQDVLGYIEQIKRETDYFGKAKLINFLIHQKHIKVKDLATALGLKPSYLCHIMRLNKLSEIIMDGYYSKLISMSHLFVLSLLHSNEDIMSIYEVVLRDGLTVLQTEELVREKLHGIRPGGSYVDESKVESLKSKVKAIFNADVKVTQTRLKTKILIEWNGSREERKKDVEALLRLIESQKGTDLE
jgi:ParB family chromosome partitioning protein